MKRYLLLGSLAATVLLASWLTHEVLKPHPRGLNLQQQWLEWRSCVRFIVGA